MASRRVSMPTCRRELDRKANSAAMAIGGLERPLWLSRMATPCNSAFSIAATSGFNASSLTQLFSSYGSLGTLVSLSLPFPELIAYLARRVPMHLNVVLYTHGSVHTCEHLLHVVPLVASGGSFLSRPVCANNSSSEG